MQQIMTPVKQRYLSPQAYVKDMKNNQQADNIEQVQFIPPQIGQGGFGKFLVKYKMPILVAR
ncbi:hypothetical protein FW755_11595 [Lonepinella koalarum]|uniref:hypothetical protein n=1 Tax=Lonepinella TaxID=53416 RepID=UPI0011E415A7|nr:hypothetical protein [Lonepinella koalarum]TYG33560.1 hypothetical protein FW755_11595 [Lonepinella koalarum]